MLTMSYLSGGVLKIGTEVWLILLKIPDLPFLYFHFTLSGKPNVPNCYEVTTRTGQPIFKVVQTLDTLPNERPSSSKPFKLSIFDMRSGNELLKLVAKQGADSVRRITFVIYIYKVLLCNCICDCR